MGIEDFIQPALITLSTGLLIFRIIKYDISVTQARLQTNVILSNSSNTEADNGPSNDKKSFKESFEGK